jgi:MoaA/NifB/PqqE/SkfB family radical SAM enzyme
MAMLQFLKRLKYGCNVFAHVQLKSIVIKPLFECVCRCGHCSERQSFYKKNKPCRLSLSSMKRIIEEADRLGAKTLQLSGGEVLLYSSIEEVIHSAKKRGWFVFINSTGWKLSHERARMLAYAGLDAFNVSIDHSNNEKNDLSRGLKGLLNETLNSLDIIHGIRKERRIFTNIQTIIMRQNYTDFPQIFDLALRHNVSSVYLMHVYDDINNEYTLDLHQIENFKNEVVPEIIEILKKYDLDERIISYADLMLNELYETRTNRLSNYAKGIYWNRKSIVDNRCIKPKTTLLVLPNGDVHPCCCIENSHAVTLGNINHNTLEGIYAGEVSEDFRKNRSAHCSFCPSAKNRTIGLIPEMLQQY